MKLALGEVIFGPLDDGASASKVTTVAVMAPALLSVSKISAVAVMVPPDLRRFVFTRRF